ncbi:DUF1571 domain-containing protein [Stieleria sp. TO1_6]|uniref:DUF1571 domain-containing protein n=1 Tax=Stieleria tagensis TaxID=2956795 RepID=UPI00209A812E|nr:DUF1571 domain-containing protein [Stieleria tagensis]MCO8122303.1 DUF1571 domain-containing protein [Stieleria tagensis]
MNALQRTSFSWFAVIAAMAPAMALAQPTSPAAMVPVSFKHQTPHPIDPALELAKECLEHSQTNVDDYNALFVKRCRVEGVMPELQFAKLKIRNRKFESDGSLRAPMSVYLNYLKPSSLTGREVIWVENANDGNLIVHESGFKGLVNVTLDPHGYLAMRNQRYPITEIGIERLLEKLIATAHRDRQHGECELKFFESVKVGKTDCRMFEVKHPVKRDHFDFYRARVYFDKELNLPIRYESSTWPETPGGEPVLQEEYAYLMLKTNVGMSDNDFDIANPDYDFR